MRLKEAIAMVLVVSVLAPGFLAAQEQGEKDEKSASESYLDAEPAGYMAGFKKAARGKNIRAAAISGGIMSVIWIVAVASAAN